MSKQQYSILIKFDNNFIVKISRMVGCGKTFDVNKLQVGQKLVKPLWKTDWQHLLRG